MGDRARAAHPPAADSRAGFRAAEHPPPSHFLVHVSDTHFVADGQLYGRVDAESHLRELLEQFETVHARPDAIVITGDLTDAGDVRSYRRLRGVVEPIAVRLGATVIPVMGNHDDRSALRSGLLGERPSAEPFDRVHWFGGLRIVVLDTSVPGRHHGELTQLQLETLRDELGTPAPEGTILAMHHPPLPSLLDLAVAVELRDQRKLADVVRGSDVRTILAGHLHYSTTGTFAGIPVSVAAASCYTQDLVVPAGGMRSRDGAQAVNLVHVYQDTILHSVVQRGDFPVLDTVSPAESAAQLERAGIRLAPLSVAAVSHGPATGK